MSPGERLAQDLTARFLKAGSFTSAPPLKSLPGWAAPALAKREELELEAAFVEGGFAGLSVQAVGHEEGGKEERVHIYVAKGSRRAIRELLTDGETVPVEVNRIGKLVVRPEQAATATNRGNLYIHETRIACGSSCAPSGESYSGTFGALVRKKGERNLDALSNNHVFAACNHTPVGMPILSPSNADGGPNIRAPGEIARHHEISELRSGEPTLVNPCEEDVAIARVPNADLVSSWQGSEDTGYDTPAKETVPASGLRVKKFGRTTGLTIGTVESHISSLMSLPYKMKHFAATVWFRNIWAVVGDAGNPFALPGDSGSLVVTEDGEQAVGLVFAVASYDYSFIIPIRRITGCFGGLSLVGGHGV